jgi:anti-anti-sigma regulatory factor
LRIRTDGVSVIESDSTIFESAQRDQQPILVKLSGEFDIRYLRTLENMLRDCLASGRSTLVDLSEVMFMDSRCVWELAVYYLLGRGRIVLCNPSQDVGVSVAAYDLEIGSISSTRPTLGFRQAAPRRTSHTTRQ